MVKRPLPAVHRSRGSGALAANLPEQSNKGIAAGRCAHSILRRRAGCLALFGQCDSC